MKLLSFLLAAALLAVFSLGASAAPAWPPDNAAYYNKATVAINTMQTAVSVGLDAYSNGDAKSLKTATADVQSAGQFFLDNQAPAALAPVSAAGRYASGTCTWVLTYFAKLGDATQGPFVMPVVLSMRSDCMNALQSAYMELARSVAAVGSYPPSK